VRSTCFEWPYVNKLYYKFKSQNCTLHYTTLHDRSRNYLYNISAKEHKNFIQRQLLSEEAVVMTANVIVFKVILVINEAKNSMTSMLSFH
jgi:hypothetical protein